MECKTRLIRMFQKTFHYVMYELIVQSYLSKQP